MFSKEERDIILKIGRYKFNKMKELGLTYEEFLEQEKQKQIEKQLKKKIGNTDFSKMKKLGLNYEEYKQYQKEQKFKKYEKKREKDKIRYKTVRYVERYCNLNMKCQICNTEENIQIHHPNYNDYLKINLLCKEHHTQLHNFELIPPEIIDLKKIAIKPQPNKEIEECIQKKMGQIKIDALSGIYSYTELSNKYNLSAEVIKRRLKKEEDWNILEDKIKKASKLRKSYSKSKHKNNPLKKYRIDNNLSIEELSAITQIPIPTLRAIESEKTDIKKIKNITKIKLEKLNLLE